MLNSFINSLFGINPNAKKVGGSGICPNCGKSLDTLPKRKTRCKYCNQDVYVRSKQTIFPTIFLNKKDAMAADWLRKLRDYNVTEDDYLETRNDLAKKFGGKPSSTDVIWGLFNRLIPMMRKNPDMLSSTYYSMALFLYEDDRDFFPLLQEAARMDLKSLKKDSIKKVSIQTCGGASCEKCQQFEGEVLTTNKALELMPIPCNECTHQLGKNTNKGFCRCSYQAEFD